MLARYGRSTRRYAAARASAHAETRAQARRALGPGAAVAGATRGGAALRPPKSTQPVAPARASSAMNGLAPVSSRLQGPPRKLYENTVRARAAELHSAGATDPGD